MVGSSPIQHDSLWLTACLAGTSLATANHVSILTAWSITWIPVALAATHDTLSSPNGPMNLPMTPYLMVLFGFFCLLEALLLALFCRSLEKRRQG